jgi:DNA-binding winged helix-turn-helix (wHTH) protein
MGWSLPPHGVTPGVTPRPRIGARASSNWGFNEAESGSLSELGEGSEDFPPFRLDTTNQYLWRSTDERAEERIALKPKTYSILAYFLDHPGRLVTQHELLDAVWPETYVQPEVVKRHIFDLREALGDNSKTPSFLETLPRRGYQFIAPIHEAGRTCSRNSPGVKLVGRDRALGELETCLHRAMRGERQIVFVTGEAGIGKTALVNELQRRRLKAHRSG